MIRNWNHTYLYEYNVSSARYTKQRWQQCPAGWVLCVAEADHKLLVTIYVDLRTTQLFLISSPIIHAPIKPNRIHNKRYVVPYIHLFYICITRMPFRCKTMCGYMRLCEETVNIHSPREKHGCIYGSEFVSLGL